MNHEYITKQVRVYATTGSRAVELDALWRIASNADLIPPTCQQLDSQQEREVLNWLQEKGFLLPI